MGWAQRTGAGHVARQERKVRELERLRAAAPPSKPDVVVVDHPMPAPAPLPIKEQPMPLVVVDAPRRDMVIVTRGRTPIAAALVALGILNGCALVDRLREDPCRALPPGSCAEPTPRPEPAPTGEPTPGPSTPTPTPTAVNTATPSPSPTATVPPPVPDVCPCVVTTTADVLSYLTAQKGLATGPEVGGYVIAHATVRFERFPDDRRGGPCDSPEREATTCKGRRCDPKVGPEWWATVPHCPEGPDPDYTCLRPLEGGWLVRVGPLAGEVSFGTLWRTNWMDQEDEARSLRRCPQAPDENEVTHSKVTVTP